MLHIEKMSKWYKTNSGKRCVLKDIDFQVTRGERVGILGSNGAGKSTLIRMIGGVELPTSGKIIRNMSVSWPIAFSEAFQGSLTGYDNLRFICRIYRVSYEEAKRKVEEFTGLGDHMREPVKSYSSGMTAKLGFGISMAVEFDCFLVDEVLTVGDEKFQEKCHHELFDKRGDRAMILVSHDINVIKAYCSRASVLVKGEMYNFSTVDDAYEFYKNKAI